MANDNLRSGPEGATKQASKLKPFVARFASPAAAVNDANTNTAITNALKGVTTAFEGTKATGQFLFLMPGMNVPEGYGGEFIVSKIWLQCTDPFLTNPIAVDVGIYARAAGTAVVTAVDANAICSAVPVALLEQAVIGQLAVVSLDGDGAGLESYTTGAGNTVSMKVGSGVAQYTDGDVDLSGQDQFLVLSVPASVGAGKYVAFAELTPVSGLAFKS